MLQEKQESDIRNKKPITKIKATPPTKKISDFDDDESDELSDLEAKLTQAELPQNVLKIVKKELKRIKKMSQQMPEYPMLRHYLELIADLPWNKATMDNIDISKAREVSETILFSASLSFYHLFISHLHSVSSLGMRLESRLAFVIFFERQSLYHFLRSNYFR